MKKKKRKIRLRTLFFLAITLASNSFAWFIYSTKVSSNITAKVKSWHVNFEVGKGQKVEEYLEINLDSIYPGMETYQKKLTAANNGEARAQITYEVQKATILEDNLKNLPLTDEQIIDKLNNDYPFTINFTVSNNIVEAQGGESEITITISWPYESGNDTEDTTWGNRAYDFHEANPNSSSISLIIKITAIQIENQ